MTQQGIHWRLARVPGYDGRPHRHMASATHWADFIGCDNRVTLRPDYGHAASRYDLRISPMKEAEPGWYHFQTSLVVDAVQIGAAFLPANIYLGPIEQNDALTEVPSCLVRFIETFGPDDAGYKLPNAPDYVGPGSWLLTGVRVG